MQSDRHLEYVQTDLEDSAEKTYDETVSDIESCLQTNHANTLAFVACLEVCVEKMPYREAEALVDESPALSLSMQNAHALMALLIGCGAIDTEEVFEPEDTEDAAREDQPLGYFVQTSAAGKEVLERYNPVVRLENLLAEEPQAYRPLYRAVLRRCREGARLSDINALLAHEEALVTPKPIYPQYFVSKLETYGGLTWNGVWNITAAGEILLAQAG